MDHTIDTKKNQLLSREEIDFGNTISDLVYQKPKKRSECINDGWNSQRPCPFVSCRHHMMIEVNQKTGGMKVHILVEDLIEGKAENTCCLDLAWYGGMTLEQVGQIMNVTRERIRQIESKAMKRIRNLNKIKTVAEEMHEMSALRYSEHDK